MKIISSIIISLFFTAQIFSQVSYQRIANIENEPGNWLTYSGNYSATRFSPLQQINTNNIQKLGTLDAHLICLDAKSGALKWNVIVGDNKLGYAITSAPVAIDGKIIIGISGGEAGIRGFLDAYNAKTGKREWRLNTIPGTGEPGNETWQGDSWKTGGAPTWVPGSYDKELNLLYWGIGNPGPGSDTIPHVRD